MCRVGVVCVRTRRSCRFLSDPIARPQANKPQIVSAQTNRSVHPEPRCHMHCRGRAHAQTVRPHTTRGVSGFPHTDHAYLAYLVYCSCSLITCAPIVVQGRHPPFFLSLLYHYQPAFATNAPEGGREEEGGGGGGGRGREGESGGARGRGFGFGFGQDAWRVLDGVPNDSAYRPAMPYEMR